MSSYFLRSLPIIIILYATQFVAYSTDCIFTVNNQTNYTFDFTELQKMGKQSTVDKDNSGLTYEFYICGNLTDVCDVNPDSGTGAVQQFSSGACQEWLGTWDSNFVVDWKNDTNPNDGITISWGEGTYIIYCAQLNIW